MKTKLRIKLILVLCSLVFLFTLSGCAIGMGSYEDVLNDKNLTAQITYYSNGGWFNGSTGIVSRDIYYTENAKAFEITTTTDTKIMRTDYNYMGWHKIKTKTVGEVAYFVCSLSSEDDISRYVYVNEAGENVSCVTNVGGENVIKISDYQEIIKTANIPTLALDTAFDFQTTRLSKNEHVYLAAKWEADQKVQFVLLTEDCTSISVTVDGQSKTYQTGDVISEVAFDSTGIVQRPSYFFSPVQASDATFVDYYEYSETPDLANLTLAFSAPISRPTDGSDVKVYAKYTAGSWTVLRAASDVKNVFLIPDKNYYLARDIDCTQSNIGEINCISGNFSGTLRGNGYEIVGLKFKKTSMQSMTSVAIFGTLTSTTKIENVTFRDVAMTVATRPGALVNVFMIAHSVASGATPTLNNVKFSGVSVDVTLAENASILNAQLEGTEYRTGHWLFGGATDNAAFIAAYPTVSFEQCKLIINTQTVATYPTVSQ